MVPLVVMGVLSPTHVVVVVAWLDRRDWPVVVVVRMKMWKLLLMMPIVVSRLWRRRWRKLLPVVGVIVVVVVGMVGEGEL